MVDSARTVIDSAAAWHSLDAAGSRRDGQAQSRHGAPTIGVSAPAIGHGGGIERYVRDLIRGLARRGIAPVVFTPRVDWSVPESRLARPVTIATSFLPTKLRDHWFAWRLRADRHRAGIDVLIGCNRADSADIGICGGTHLGFLRAVGRRPRPADRWQIALERRYYARASVIVAHSNLMRDELMALYGIAESKIRVHHVPVDDARFTPADPVRRRQLRRKWGFGDDEIVLLFPSTSHERKGLAVIERAVQGTTLPAVVAVAGRPPPRTSERVRYLGFVKEIEECYQAADFTILGSRYEPFGIVGVETVMCGTPAILSSRVRALEVIAPHAKFTFEPDDVDSVRDAIAGAVRSRGARSVSGADLLYDASLDRHVDRLLALAQRVHGRTGAAWPAGEAALQPQQAR